MNDRDRKILVMLATGLTVEQIGEALILSPLTVRDRLGTIARELGIKKPKGCRGAALVAWTWRNLIGGWK